MNEHFRRALETLEQDNADLLSENAEKHSFPLSFERRALRICRGTETIAPERRIHSRRIPVWAAAVLILLATLALAGCAVAAYLYFFPKSIPYYGIVDFDSDIRMYSTTEKDRAVIDDIEIETLLLIGEKENYRIMLWGNTQTEYTISPSGDNTVIANVLYDEKMIPLVLTGTSSDGTGYGITAEAELTLMNPPAETLTFSITHNSVSTDIFLEDISNKGYEVSSWVQLADITVKILPVYTNSRIFIVQCSGPENSVISASFKAFDADGNSIHSVSSYSENGEYFLAECDQTLPGDVCRIEIENLRVRVNITNSSELYKIEPDQIFPLPLWSCPLFKETAMAYDGENFKTVIEVNSSYNDCEISFDGMEYDADGLSVYEMRSYTPIGNHSYEWNYVMRKADPDSELVLSPAKYIYSIYPNDTTDSEILVTKK